MPRVRSDEMNGDGDDHIDIKEKTPSPIGAGLPLLQRLRLLKEKQVSFYSHFIILNENPKQKLMLNFVCACVLNKPYHLYVLTVQQNSRV